MKSCKECSESVVLKEGQEIQGVGKISQDVAEGEFCLVCLSKGWTRDPREVADAILSDPALRKTIALMSPIQREDLTV